MIYSRYPERFFQYAVNVKICHYLLCVFALHISYGQMTVNDGRLCSDSQINNLRRMITETCHKACYFSRVNLCLPVIITVIL